ncbi:MAG: type II toxin-antitoxin system CcdA family antitoxin [Gammaproteobacteria bacterium]|nr:type II toxin-antitoxin system CcdA family antitoxin [Gammaproteobacteria bacterium]MBU1724174.1 type II toxin-antitoxin system CcdA family antitoxin [Gammaproteobacteria bacterium]MBU2006729.1 type II toxin-antitoxin system CcdA family antitoxin [Gammaproteobacteria bacterium]
MQVLYDTNAPKKATNLSINSDLLQKARTLNINLSAALESALQQLLAKRQADQWKAENKAAITAYNDFVEENGCFGDEYRNF